MSSPNLPRLAPRACEFCHTRQRLLRCSGCHTVFYCGPGHQSADRASHKEACVAIKRARAHMDREEHELRHMPDDILTPPNVFETQVGHFWGIFDTRSYMRARFGLVDALLQHFCYAGGRAYAVQAALDHLLDMLRLCRSDNLGVRKLVPALYIRLGRDQAAYDFMKWYAIAGRDSPYDWGNMNLPFLDVENADVLESPKGIWSTTRRIHLNYIVVLTLIKVRVLFDLQATQNAAKALGGAVPQEIIDLIRRQLVGSVVGARPEILMGGTEDVGRLVESIKGQVRMLYKSIDEYNPHFWPSMLDDPAAVIAARPDSYSPGRWEEASLMLGYNFASWAETPGAIDMIRTLSEAL